MKKLLCPACGAEITLEQLEQTGDLLALHRAVGAFGEDWGLVREYIELFRVKQPLKVAKILRLAREVWQTWHTGHFEYGGQHYRVGQAEFRETLRGVCNRGLKTLTNHNYLKSALTSAAQQTSQRRERELREKEAGLRADGPEGEVLDTLAPPADPKWREEASRLSKAVRRAKTPEERAQAQAALEDFLRQDAEVSE